MNNYLHEQDVLDNRIYPGISKSRLDLTVLRYMARKVHVTLKLLDQPATALQPLLYCSDERHGRTQRIVIYNYWELLLNKSVAFVGFISRRQKPINAAVIAEIHQVDKQLVAELINSPGILSYSSLELRTGSWYNLVLLSDTAAKAHIKNSTTHAYAAYQLAPRYYEWIRLHQGVLPQGLAQEDMQLLKTKYYTFQVLPSKPAIRERSYDVHDIPVL